MAGYDHLETLLSTTLSLERPHSFGYLLFCVARLAPGRASLMIC